MSTTTPRTTDDRDPASHTYYAQVDAVLERIRDQKSLEAVMIRSILGTPTRRLAGRVRSR